MKLSIGRGTCAAVLISICLALIAPRAIASPRESRAAIDPAIAAVKPALVRIKVAWAEYEQGREVKYEAFGSGFIISPEGYVVTNHHVAGRAKTIVCTLADRTEIEADLVGSDPLADIAVIKLRAPGRKFPTASWADSSLVRVGDSVLAMGSPVALSQSVTLGIVSNTEMILPVYAEGKFKLEGEDVGSLVRWIGHDAAIYPGNSGGPLVNLSGRVIGINEIDLGLSGAIPSNIARHAAEEIIKHGSVSRAWIGVIVQPILRSGKVQRGVLVGGAIPGSPAAAAGFKSGDILLRLAGHDITVRFAEQMPLFNQMVSDLPIGKKLDALVLRAGKELTLYPVTGKRPESEPRPVELKPWGMCVSDISFTQASEMKRATRSGVLVKNVRPGGPCGEAKPGIIDDDVIIAVDGKPVSKVADLIAITSTLTKGKIKPVSALVRFDRKSEQLLTVVKVGKKDFDDPGSEVQSAFLPVSTQVLTTEVAQSLGVDGRTGVRITEVYRGSSAEKAGLQVGDLIVKLAGGEIAASQPEDLEVLPTMVRQYNVGQRVDLTILRDKRELTIPVELEASRPLQREMKKYRDDNYEFVARDLAFQDYVDQMLDRDLKGALVQEISDGGWAQLAGLAAEDVILEVDGRKIANIDDLRKALERVAAAKPKHVVLEVRRGIENKFIELDADWPHESNAKRGKAK